MVVHICWQGKYISTLPLGSTSLVRRWLTGGLSSTMQPVTGKLYLGFGLKASQQLGRLNKSCADM